MILKKSFLLIFIVIFVIKVTPFSLIKNNKGDLDRDMYIILSKIRCIECPGENVVESSSSFARMIKNFVYLRIKDKISYKDIMEELVNIFGTHILM